LSTFVLVKPSTFVPVKQVISTTCRMRKQVRTISSTKALQLVALKYLLLRANAATHRSSVWVVMSLAVKVSTLVPLIEVHPHTAATHRLSVWVVMSLQLVALKYL
jgi:hypothetical protein